MKLENYFPWPHRMMGHNLLHRCAEKRNFKKAISLIFITCIYSVATFASENLERLSNPFLLPQTNIVVGNSNYSSQLSGSNSYTFPTNGTGINVYGFEIEVNHSKYLNIGAFFRYSSQTALSHLSVDSQPVNPSVEVSYTTGIIGGYTRFYYVPQFLRSQWNTTNLFARLELGGGPMMINSFKPFYSFTVGGLTAQGGAHLGIESYFSKWVGIGFSYGRIFELGKNSLADKSVSSVWSTGGVFLVSLKTTLF